MPARTLKKHHEVLLFAGLFFIGLAMQTALCLTFPVADEGWWSDDAEKIAAGEVLDSSDVTYVHPGTTILYPMAGLVYFGIDSGLAVRLVMAFFAALLTTLAAFIAYRLWPGHLWWLAIALILFADIRLLHGTPPSTAAALLTILFVLLYLYARRKEVSKDLKPLIYLGIYAGALLATRVDTAALILLTALPFLLFVFRLRVFVFLLSTSVAFVALNPHIWADSTMFMKSISDQISANKELIGREILQTFLVTFPFAIFSMLISGFVIAQQFLRPKEDELHVPLDVYVWFLGVTLLITELLAPLLFHPIRYHMPFYLAWDILLPLWLFLLLGRHLPFRRAQWLTGRRFEWLVIGLIVLILCVRFYLFVTADTQWIIL